MLKKPFVTVIICTRDRTVSLARTLESIVAAAPHVSDAWELLVVDNGSTDETAATIDGFAGRLPVRRVWQPFPGLSNARNAGVAEASGEYMLWTDDDVIVDEQWLAAWFRAFHGHHMYAVFGGRAVPLYEEPHQPWFKANERFLSPLLAIRDESDWNEIQPHQLPWGLNYAVRAVEQRRHRYDPDLGVAPGRRRGGEEEAVLTAIINEGHKGLWVWDASVSHVIPKSRQTRRYILSYYRSAGFDHPIYGTPVGLKHRMSGIWYATKQLLKTSPAYVVRANHPHAIRWLVTSAMAWGSLRRYLGVKAT